MRTLVLAVAVMLTGISGAHAKTDWVQLATNMIWCYQNPNHVAEQYTTGWSTYVTSDDGKTWTISAQPTTNVSRSRAEYVRDIQIAAARKDAAMAREIYLMCQRHNDSALVYANTAEPQEWVDAVAHAAACYSPDTGTNSPRIRTSDEVFNSKFGPITCVH